MKLSRQWALAEILLLALIGLAASGPGVAQSRSSYMRFTEQGGEALFKGICQGCHMPDAKGAVGAAAYPALAGNPNLAGRGYPVVIVVNGQKAMPAFGSFLTDQQVADVVNYVRSHFGNHYTDKVTVSEIQAVRPPPPQAQTPAGQPPKRKSSQATAVEK